MVRFGFRSTTEAAERKPEWTRKRWKVRGKLGGCH